MRSAIEPLENLAREVVVVVDAPRRDVEHVKADDVENLGRFPGGQFGHDVSGNLKDVEIINVQYLTPGVQDFRLRIGIVAVADLLQRLDAVLAGQPFVKQHGVGDDGAGHAVHLRHVAEVQAAGDGRVDLRPGFGHTVQHVGGRLYTLLQVVGSFRHRFLRHGHQPDEIGQLRRRAVQPSRLRKATAVFINYAVG